MANETFDARLRNNIETDTFEKDGAIFWNMGNPVPVDCFEDAGLPVPSGQRAAIKAKLDAFLKDYNPGPPSDEELFEMRAAFGEGETVVNVITGRKIQL